MFDYIEKYGNISFEEKSITEIDILIFSCLIYNDYSSIFSDINSEFLMKDIIDTLIINNSPEGMSRNLGKSLLQKIKNKTRYANLLLKNYYYELGDGYQFGAITIDVNNNLFVCFEGTDATIQGWKENLSFSYLYPTESQLLSEIYINKVVKYDLKKVTICGHSKGGNLAVVSAMGLNNIKKQKLQKVYSFDGPGLPNGIYGCDEYNKIKNKIVHIIPEQSLFGILLYSDKSRVIKARDKGLMQHAPANWIVDDDTFVSGIQTKESTEFKDALESWIFGVPIEERKELIDIFFDLLQNSKIERISDFSKDLKNSLFSVYKTSKDLSKETKNMLFNTLKSLAYELSKYNKENINSKVRTLINKKNKENMVQ